MRFRRVRPSDGLLGQEIADDRILMRSEIDERPRRYNIRFLLSLAAVLMTITVCGLSRYCNGPNPDGIWSLFSTDDSHGKYDSSPWGGWGAKKSSHGKGGSSSEDSWDAHCIPSSLEKKGSTPKYGCRDITAMLKGEKKYLGHGYWRDVVLVNYGGKDLAVKTLRHEQEETRRNKERHRWEAAALDAVKDSPNIVHLLGKCDSDMVTEYFPEYLDVLLIGENADSSEDDPATPEPLSTRRILTMALDAARGLQALHEAEGGPIVHADLQPRQLLLNQDGMVKINDLNRCRFMRRDSNGDLCPFQISKGNGVWRSPEEYHGRDGRLTEKLDIYSMGLIFWAMYGRETPYKRDETYKDRVAKGERPRVESTWHQGFVQLFQDMWKGEAAKRPTAGEIVERLEAMLAILPPDA